MAIVQLLRDEDKRRCLGEKARERAVAVFEWSVVAENLEMHIVLR